MRLLQWIAILTILSGTPGLAATATMFVVAPDGDDAAPGTQEQPFATLQRARDAVRGLKQEGGGELPGPTIVRLREGTYFLDEPLELGPQDSGTDNAPVIWEAWPGERAIVSGGSPVTDWEQAGDGSWSATIPEARNSDWNFRQIFVREAGERDYTRRYRPTRGLFVIAGLTDAPYRYPDRPVNHRNPQKEFYFHEGDIENWENLSDVEVVVMHDWSSGRLNIEEIDFEDNIVRFTDYPHYRIGHWYPGGRNPYLVENIKEDFGKPGEWYLDRPTGTLSYTPAADEEMADLEVIAPRIERLLRVTGDREAEEYVEDLMFRGIVFAHSAWKDSPHRYAEAYGRACRQGFVDMPSAIELKWARNCRFEACTMAHLGSYALDFGEGCHDNAAIGNRIFDCGTGGVKVGVVDRSAEPPVVPTGNLVESNLVSDVGIVHYSGHGIWGGVTSDLAIRHNEVRRTLYSAIAVGWSHSTAETACHDNKMEYNHVHDVMLLLDHGGALYTLGYQPGTVLRGNVIHDTHQTRLHGRFERPIWAGGGLAFDDGSSGFIIEDNVIYDLPVDPARPVESQADQHEVGTNYFDIAPGEEGFPTEIAQMAGPESQWQELTGLPVEVPEPHVLSLPYPFDAPPLRIADSFEKAEVGGPPSRVRVRREDQAPGKGTDAVEVTDETAASGEKSLLLEDAPDLSHDWVPYINYSPGYAAGVAQVTFDIRLEEGAIVECAWRGAAEAREFVVGPQITLRDGGLWVGDEMLMEVPLQAWLHVEMEAPLGAPDPGIGGAGLEQAGQWALRVKLPEEDERVFEDLSVIDDEFHDLRWVGFISLATEKTRFFLDNVSIGVEK